MLCRARSWLLSTSPKRYDSDSLPDGNECLVDALDGVARTLSATSALSRTKRRLAKRLHPFGCYPSDPLKWSSEHSRGTLQLPEHFRPLAGAVECIPAAIAKALYSSVTEAHK
jgi:hypothetical protein